MLLSAAAVAVMCRVGALDHPVARSSHAVPTPKGGGVGIVLGFATGFLAATAGRPDVTSGAVLAASVGLAAFSYLDDIRQYSFRAKLASQALAAGTVILAGGAPAAVELPGWGLVPLGPAAPVLAFAWILAVTNAVNFMDGLNGLASGSVAILCLVTGMAAGVANAIPECLLCASILGFLPFNYPRARIFMGDVGSQFIGFLIAAFALRHAGQRLSLLLPLGLLPMIADVAFTLARRWRAGDKLTEAHRSHLYQMANRAGVNARVIAPVYWALSALGAMTGWADEHSTFALSLSVFVIALITLGVAVRAATRAAGIARW